MIDFLRGTFDGVVTILAFVVLMRLLGYRMTRTRGKHEVNR